VTLVQLRAAFERLLETVLITLMVALTVVVLMAVIYRKAGASLAWYDEIASIILAWITYYGAALAALKRAHIGFDGILLALPPNLRAAGVLLAEFCVIGFFAVLAWNGWRVLQVLAGDTLVSLPQVPVQVTQSVIPIGAALFILCELLSLPDYWRRVRAGQPLETLPAADPGGAEPGGADPGGAGPR
jgi:TRAP-type C4-dicarboxylate transport system permease small subunit